MAQLCRILCIVFAACVAATPAAAQPKIGTSLNSIWLWAHGDCDTIGACAGSQWGVTGAAQASGMTKPLVEDGYGIFPSYSHYFINIGPGIDAEFDSGTLTLAGKGLAFSVNIIKASGGGSIPGDVPGGLSLIADFTQVRATLAGHLGELASADSFFQGLHIGVMGSLPGIDNRLRLEAPGLGLQLADVRQERARDLTFGVFKKWHGKWDGLSVGAFINTARLHEETNTLDLVSGDQLLTKANSYINVGRVGGEASPAKLLGIDASSLFGRLVRPDTTINADYEHRNLTTHGEGTVNQDIGYVGINYFLPDALLGPMARCFDFVPIAGVDTNGGYGAGGGVYPKISCQWPVSLNVGYFDRPLPGDLGRMRATMVSVAIALPWGQTEK